MEPALSAEKEASLIAQAKKGNEAAISQLYRQHAPGIYGYVASRVGDPALADDLIARHGRSVALIGMVTEETDQFPIAPAHVSAGQVSRLDGGIRRATVGKVAE